MRVFAWLIAATLLTSVAVAAVDLHETLTPLAPLVGTCWTGRFVSTPAPPFDHEIEWSATLGGHVVKWVKWVEELDFTMETSFYWDAEAETIAFTQLASNGNHSRGTATSEDGRMTLMGLSIRPSGFVEFRQTFEIMPDGTLEDRYYSRGADGWIPEHVIVYERCP